MKVKTRLLYENAKAPKYAHTGDAGADLFCLDGFIVAPGQRVLVKTGIAIEMPSDHVGLIWDKSSIGGERMIKTLGGVIDANYRGEIIVGLINLGQIDQKFMAGDKIAQILFQKISSPDIEIVKYLNDSERGDGAFGSSGR